MGMNKLSPAKRAQIVAALVEGNSIRATCRMTDTAKGTVLKLLVDLGRACEGYQRQTLVNLKPRLIQCDEIWSFVGCKLVSTSPCATPVYGRPFCVSSSPPLPSSP